MYGISEEQKEILEENPTVEHYGVVMVSGVVAETEADKTPGVGLLYADDTYWKKMMAPARKFVKGHYPVEENEVMVTEDALKKCGFSDKKIGDEITFVYEINEKREAKTFRISGIWDGYGDTDNFYMSKAFCDKQKLDAVYYGRCHISFCKKWMSDEAQQAFIDSMKLKKSQRLFYVYEYGNATEIFLGLAGIALVTVLSAYLLIYNIMYLSVAGNIRYYGLLQTVGMSRDFFLSDSGRGKDIRIWKGNGSSAGNLSSGHRFIDCVADWMHCLVCRKKTDENCSGKLAGRSAWVPCGLQCEKEAQNTKRKSDCSHGIGTADTE